MGAINESNVIAINAASAALSVSDIPWNDPIGITGIRKIDNNIIITRYEIQVY